MTATEGTHAKVSRRFGAVKETALGDRARESLKGGHVAPHLATLLQHEVTVGLCADLGQSLLDGCEDLSARGWLVDAVDGRNIGGRRFTLGRLRIRGARREDQHGGQRDETPDAAKREHEFAAEHIGELLVDHRNIEGVRFEHRDGGCTVGGLGGLVTGHLKGHEEPGALVGLSLGDEDGRHGGSKIPPATIFNQST